MRNSIRWLFVIAAIGCWSPLAQAVTVRFQSEPAGATVTVIGPADAVRRIKNPTGTTPCELDLPRSTLLQVTFAKAGFETLELTVNTREAQQPYVGNLLPLVVERPVEFESSPAGAEILIDGAKAGVTPLTRTLQFERTSSKGAWKTFGVRMQKAEYQPEETRVTLGANLQAAKASLTLGRIAEDRVLEIIALDEGSRPIPTAELIVNDQPVGKANDKGVGQITLPFRRPDRTAPWSEFNVVIAVKNEYQPGPKTIKFTDPIKHEFRLKPVTEVSVPRYAPSTEMTSRGPRLQVNMTETIGILNDNDPNSPRTELRQVTNFDRRQATVRAVNSFTVTPDGKNIIYAVTALAEEGKPYSNLFLKGVQSASITLLTQGTRYLDSYPTMSSEEGSALVVFQSNRGVPETWDISAVRVDSQRIIGGVQQLTRDARFNYGPALASEQHPVFFSSVEETPRSPALISSVRVDGSTFTSHGELGEMLCYAASGTLYLSRPDLQSGKYQIYSLAVDGQVLSTVLNDDQFAKANCTWPAVSPSADRLLFVSDYAEDEKGRKNNNIYIYDLKSGKLAQLTTNGSDDIMPRWSPTEPNVIYFISNRQGVYNIWRMGFRLAQ